MADDPVATPIDDELSHLDNVSSDGSDNGEDLEDFVVPDEMIIYASGNVSNRANVNIRNIIHGPRRRRATARNQIQGLTSVERRWLETEVDIEEYIATESSDLAEIPDDNTDDDPNYASPLASYLASSEDDSEYCSSDSQE